MWDEEENKYVFLPERKSFRIKTLNKKQNSLTINKKKHFGSPLHCHDSFTTLFLEKDFSEQAETVLQIVLPFAKILVKIACVIA